MQKMVNGKLVDMTQEEVNIRDVETANNDAEQKANAYVEKRLAELPSIGDQLDALWKGGADADAMKLIISEIKTKYPKQ